MVPEKQPGLHFLKPGSSYILLYIALLVISSACGQAEAPAGPSIPRGTQAADPNWYALYFTQPGSPQAESFRGGPAENLVQALDQARLSLDVAAYDLNLWDVRDALLQAQQRGVQVRLVTDAENLGTPEIEELRQAGIPVVGDNQNGLMHNKFVVIDRREVWTGSMNLTVNSAYRNNDNLVRIRSADLAENYLREFEEMFLQHSFGADSPANTPKPTLMLQGTRLENYFSPDDGVAARLLELIDGAQESIHFLAYSFTMDDLAEAIIERAQAGVQVSGVMEAQQVGANAGGEYERFRQAGLDVRLDGNPQNMHHKVIIIDGQTVVTGSYNFSKNAETRNDENILVIHNQDIAQKFLEEFYQLFNAAQ